MKMKTQWSKPIRYSKNSIKRKGYSNTSWPEETRKPQINNLTLHLKQLEKEHTKSKLVEGKKSLRLEQK